VVALMTPLEVSVAELRTLGDSLHRIEEALTDSRRATPLSSFWTATSGKARPTNTIRSRPTGSH
jgi:hypothetical protein